MWFQIDFKMLSFLYANYKVGLSKTKSIPGKIYFGTSLVRC